MVQSGLEITHHSPVENSYTFRRNSFCREIYLTAQVFRVQQEHSRLALHLYGRIGEEIF